MANPGIKKNQNHFDSNVKQAETFAKDNINVFDQVITRTFPAFHF